MYYKCSKIDSHSSATNFGFDKKLKIDFPVCTIYSIRIAICISRTAIHRDAVLVGDTQPYHNLCFEAKIRKIGIPLHTPVLLYIPQFCYIKVGYKGVYIAQTCFPDEKHHLYPMFTVRHLYGLMMKGITKRPD